MAKVEKALADLAMLGADEKALAAELRVFLSNYDMDRMLAKLAEVGHESGS